MHAAKVFTICHDNIINGLTDEFNIVNTVNLNGVPVCRVHGSEVAVAK